MSIITLVASLCVSIANYPARINNALINLNKLKRLKKTIEENLYIINDSTYIKESHKKYTNDYHNIVDNMECRSNFRFFHYNAKKIIFNIAHLLHVRKSTIL